VIYLLGRFKAAGQLTDADIAFGIYVGKLDFLDLFHFGLSPYQY